MSELRKMQKEAARLERELQAVQEELQVTQVLDTEASTLVAQVHVEIYHARAKLLFGGEEYMVAYSFKKVSDAKGVMGNPKGDHVELQHLISVLNSSGDELEQIDESMATQMRLAIREVVERK